MIIFLIFALKDSRIKTSSLSSIIFFFIFFFMDGSCLILSAQNLQDIPAIYSPSSCIALFRSVFHKSPAW